MTITFISDTHDKHAQITKDLPGGDFLVHAGDITSRGTPEQILNFLYWFSDLPYRHKVFIAGNHDWAFEHMDTIAPEFEEKGVVYLMDRIVELDGIKIYGTPWQPRFFDWAFNVERGDAIAKKWEPIPEGLDILISHGPAHGILDYTPNMLKVGCEELYKKVVEVKPRFHVSGHIHGARGLKEFNGTTFINASCLDERYRYANIPIVLDYDIETKGWDYISI